MTDNIILKWFRKRLFEQNKNMMIVMYGETGSGKSNCALRIGELFDPNFKIANVVYSPQEFMSLLNSPNIEKGSVIVWDEAGVGIPSNEWYTVSNKIVNYVMQTFRTKNLIVIFTTPSLRYIDSRTQKLFHVAVESLFIDQHKKLAHTKFLRMQYNSRYDKTYNKYLVYYEHGVRKQLTKVRFGKVSKKLWDKYEIKRDEFTERLNRQSEVSLKEMDIRKKKSETIFTDDEIVDIVRKNNVKYMNRLKRVSVEKLMWDFSVGLPRAKKIKSHLDATMN